RYLVVGADRKEIRRHLLALGDVHRNDLVWKLHLFQRDADLAAVRRVPGVQFDGHFFLAKGFRTSKPRSLTTALSACRPCGCGTYNHHCLWRAKGRLRLDAASTSVVIGPGSRFAWPGRHVTVDGRFPLWNVRPSADRLRPP